MEEGPPHGHLREDAARGPHVDGGGVAPCPQEDLGRAVPQGHHLVGVGLVVVLRAEARHREPAELGDAVHVHQDAPGGEVAVEEAQGVAVGEPAEDVAQAAPGGAGRHRLVAGAAQLVLERREPVEREPEPPVGLHSVQEPDDVRVLRQVEERGLAEGKIPVLVLVPVADPLLLQEDELPRLLVARLPPPAEVGGAVERGADRLDLLVPVHAHFSAGT
mmetsp:Transcript_6795/g.16427  ORF Transcript_6795/g.16427 Transcript_6795/m.16427 type:complete len:218 (+) Transcript_6795:400-1053(+)